MLFSRFVNTQRTKKTASKEAPLWGKLYDHTERQLETSAFRGRALPYSKFSDIAVFLLYQWIFAGSLADTNTLLREEDSLHDQTSVPDCAYLHVCTNTLV